MKDFWKEQMKETAAQEVWQSREEFARGSFRALISFKEDARETAEKRELEGTVAADGAEIGRVARVLNYGAGDVLEIERPGRDSLLLPFAEPMVGEVELERGRVFVAPPDEVEARGDEPEDAAP
jgi:hypothetical protein